MNPPDADEILLGEILNGTKDFDTVAAQFSPDDFRSEKHRRIFTRMAELHECGEPIDRVHVANELMKHNELDVCGGLSYLVKLSDYGEYQYG
jgi:replicative DNA helicase